MALLETDVVKTIGRVRERPNQYVRLARNNGPSDEPEKPRKGTEFFVPLVKSNCRAGVMSKARFESHSGTLEAGGVALGLRWLLRSAPRHVLRAVAKGSSSARRVRADVAHVAALCIAGHIMLRLVYVPSWDNQAKEPSRGSLRVRRLSCSCVRRGACTEIGKTKREERYEAELLELLDGSIKRLTHTGTIASRNAFRRAFKLNEWSDVDSLNFLDANC